MGRMSFVAWLFIMAFSCLTLAVLEFSLGWLIGGILFLSIALYAKHKFKKESETGRKGVSLVFFGTAMLFMLIAMGFLFWLQSSA